MATLTIAECYVVWIDKVGTRFECWQCVFCDRTYWPIDDQVEQLKESVRAMLK